MNITKTSLTGIFLGAFALTAFAQEKPAAQAAEKVATDGAKVGVWTMDYDAATKLAVEKKLPMLLNFTGSDWCGWCRLMDESVFSTDTWKKFAAENVVLVTLDFPRNKEIVPEKFVEQNTKLKEQFDVHGFPTYIILDIDAKTKIGQLGAGRDVKPEDFIKQFKGVVRLSDANVAAYCKAHPEKADAYKAAIKELADSKKALSDWIATKPVRNEENTKAFEAHQARIKSATEKLESFE